MEDIGQLPPRIATPLPGEVCARYLDALAVTECPGLTARRARQGERSGAAHDPIVWVEAVGANVVDADGNRFVDMSAGFGAAAVGHRHPLVVAAVKRQADRLLHALGDLHPSEVKIRLLQRLAPLAPFDQARSILGLNGSDAVEAALKSALLTTGKPGVLAFEGGYHGLSHGSLAACGYSAAFRQPFTAQLNPLVSFAPYPRQPPGGDPQPDLARAMGAVLNCWDSSPEPIGAVLVEPIQGRGGVLVPAAGFLIELASLCRKRGALLIADEIFTGLGRAGALWQCQEQGVVPDLLCAGKALGGGLPISACIGQPGAMSGWGDPGDEALYAGTFFGHPLGCAAALAALEVIEQESLIERSRSKGRLLKQTLQRQSSGHDRVKEVRGEGLMIGVELDRPAGAVDLSHLLLQRGYIATPAGSGGQVLSLTPPLNIAAELLDGFAQTFHACLELLT